MEDGAQGTARLATAATTLLPRRLRRRSRPASEAVVSMQREAAAFLEAVVAFPAVPAGGQGEVLLRVADQLCAELGHREDEAGPSPGGASPLAGGNGMAGVLTPEDEMLVGAMRLALARVAAAAGATRPVAAPEGAVGAALDGAEMVIRGELVSGNAARLESLMPSFVFLVTLPIVEQDEALDLSRRAAELLDQRLGD